MTASMALITGASRGIGREVACTLASEGWRVLSGVRDPKSAPHGTQPEVVDVADPDSIEALAERLRARSQVLDALVNNAGVYRGPARRIWDVNVLGPLRLTRALEPLLARGSQRSWRCLRQTGQDIAVELIRALVHPMSTWLARHHTKCRRGAQTSRRGQKWMSSAPPGLAPLIA